MCSKEMTRPQALGKSQIWKESNAGFTFIDGDYNRDVIIYSKPDS